MAFEAGLLETLSRCFRPPRCVRERWYRFKCWLWHRYTTVKPRWLDHTWCDVTDLLPYAMFEILGRFIENECSPGIVDWEASDHRIEVDGVSKNVRDEMQDLWDWWCNVYLVEYDRRRDELHAAIHKIEDAERLPATGQEKYWNPKYKTPEATAQIRDFYLQLHRLEVEQEQALQVHLHRLVNIREYLWT